MEHWDNLRIFLAVARLGTLAAAGKSLDLNPSTLHRKLAAFEAELGASLFEKGPRGYQVTSAGEVLFERALEVEEAVFAASRTIMGYEKNASGDVRITLPLAMVPMLVPILIDFRLACPDVRVILLADDRSLDIGRATDVALRSTDQPLPSAVGRNLCGLGWCRYTHSASELDDVPWVDYADLQPAPAVSWFREQFPGSTSVMQVRGVPGMLEVLAAGVGQGLLPCFVGDADPRLRRIGDTIAQKNNLWMLIHADLRRSARVRALVDFLVPRLLEAAPLFEGTRPLEGS